jgi:ubiquinol-cytochrome c reductase cytochrome c subunit
MRRRLAPALLVVAFALAAAAIALAEAPPSGIVHIPGQQNKPLVEQGAQLYAGNCSGCHGIAGTGVTAPAQRGPGNVKGQGPPLRGVGALAADFYLRTGYMPLRKAHEQPYRSRTLFSDHEIQAMTAYIAGLGKGPAIPQPHPETGTLSEGMHLFTEHCAGCHQIVGEGGYVTDKRVPPLKDATPTQVAEAVRIGPYYMPKFSTKDISDRELDSIVAYVQSIKHPDDRGGWGIGHIGPVPEGLVTWLLAAVVLIATCMVIGKRLSG